MVKKNSLRLIQGGIHQSMSFGPVRIVSAPENAPPFRVQALVFEEDTWLIMSANPESYEPEEHPIRMMTQMIEARPEQVGTVLVRGNNPMRFLAIVHDVDQEPTWRESWVESALLKIFLNAEQRGIQSIGLPLIGTLHGKLGKQRFVELLYKVLVQMTFNHLKRLWLITPAENGKALSILDLLKSILLRNENK